MSEPILITIPISKTYYTTFINSYILIYYFNDNSFTLESLKSLLFPTEFLDKDFDNLVNFISAVFDEYIKNGKEGEEIKKELENKVTYIH